MFYSLVDNTESFALYFKVGMVSISIVVREDLDDFEKKLHVTLDCTDNHKIYFIDEDTYNAMYSFIRDELGKFLQKVQRCYSTNTGVYVMIPFECELELINNIKVRETTAKILCQMPKWFMKEGASSTGKYHPQYAQGEGGLYRHTCAAVKIYNDIASLEQYKEVIDNKDWGIAALILHDMCKYGYDDIPSKYTRFDHPLLVRKWLEYLQYESGAEEFLDEEYINNVCNLVESHMGQWNTNKYYPDVILPTPLTFNQQLVHLADYLASRNYLEVKFN